MNFGLIIPAHKRINASQQKKCNGNNCGHTFDECDAD